MKLRLHQPQAIRRTAGGAAATCAALLLSACTTETQLIKEANAEVRKPTICATGPVNLSPSEKEKIGLTTTIVKERDVPIVLDLAAIVKENSNMTTPVRSLVPGKLERVYVQVGDMVKKGQILADLRSEAVGQIQSDFLEDYLELEAQRKQLELEQALAQKNYNRKKTLVDEKIGARADLEQAENDLDKAKAALMALDGKLNSHVTMVKEKLRIYGITGDAIDSVIKSHQIDQTFSIECPRTGFIAKREADTGQNIDTSNDLFVVTDLSEIWLVAQVFEKSIDDVRLDAPVTALVDSFPRERFTGKLDYIGANIDTETRTLPVRATVTNTNGKLKPQMFGHLLVQTGMRHSVCVPEAAVQKIGEAYVAYVVKGPDSYEERKLEVGPEEGGFTTVKSGLKKGETVVVKGSLQLLGQALKRLSQ